MGILIRLLIFFLFRFRFGPLILGIIVLAVGAILGASSHQVAYKRVEQAKMIHYLSGSDSDKSYIQLEDSSLYVLEPKKFTPSPDADNLLSPIVTLVYDPQDTESVDVESSNTSTRLKGSGATIYQMISYSRDGAAPKTFSSSDYTANPNGFYHNNWPLGGAIMVGGLILCVVPFFRKATQKATAQGFNVSPAAPRPGFNVSPSAQQQPYPQQPYPQQPYPAQGAPGYPQPYPAQPSYPGVPPTTPGYQQTPQPSYPGVPPTTPGYQQPSQGGGYAPGGAVPPPSYPAQPQQNNPAPGDYPYGNQ